jgi:hypothetical protein
MKILRAADPWLKIPPAKVVDLSKYGLVKVPVGDP